jgi:hypothetical protein
MTPSGDFLADENQKTVARISGIKGTDHVESDRGPRLIVEENRRRTETWGLRAIDTSFRAIRALNPKSALLFHFSNASAGC